jgi:asparagine synthase (glutamine-hydrolysing)
MCGIAGYWGTEALPEDREAVCLSLMGHRGPDARGTYHDQWGAGRSLSLLHTRLSIIDLDARAGQPFHHGPAHLAYNGELYNYRELKNNLKKQGVRFNTESDTEVLLHQWLENAERGLDSCEGMWAFALFNSQTKELVLCRDRFGEKPLYFFPEGSGFYFGSEVKFIQALCGHRLKINISQLTRYLVYGYRTLYSSRETFFQGLEEVAPGTVLRIAATGEKTQARYWTPSCRPDLGLSYSKAVQGVRERLLRSVELRLRADVPLAFCMSGGIDSNSLVSIAKRCHHHDVHGFTIVNTDPHYQEQDIITQSVGELGIRHTSVPLQAEGFLPRLRTLVKHHDSPVYTISYYVQWRLMEQVAKQGYKIVISGTGADELFSGYYDHYLAYFYQLRNNAEALEKAKRYWEQHVQPLVRNPYLKDPSYFLNDPANRSHLFLREDEFRACLKTPSKETFQETVYTNDLLRNRMLNELFHEVVPVILHEDDLNSMYFSMENRSPFLDRGLFEFSSSIPTEHLLHSGPTKSVLRDAMRGIVPDVVLNNPRKVGFNAPLFSLLDHENPAVKAELLNESPVYNHVLREKISALLEKPRLENSESKFLFNFINCKLFLELFDA